MESIQYSSASPVINGTSQTPISNTETAVINVFGPPASATNDADYQHKYLKDNTQATLGWDYTAGQTTSVTFRIYYYRYEVNANANPYQATTYTQSSGAFTILPWTLVVPAASAGRMSFDFALPACDGIKITAQSAGTTTSSTLTEIHLNFRVN